LISKADNVLREWRNDDGSDHCHWIWAGMAMSLEQAIGTLQALDDAPTPVIVTFDDE